MGLTTLDFAPAAALTGEWSFWADTITGSVPLGPVDVAQFWCTSRLSGFGSGGVQVAMPCGIDPARLLRLWSWRLWAFYDGELYWCGVPSGVTDENGSEVVTLTLTELPGYLRKRQFDEHPFYQTPPGGAEQTAIALRLAAPVAEVGVRLVADPGPGLLRDRKYEYLEGAHRGELLSNLAGVIGGPEFRAEYAMTAAGRPECTLRIAYPRVGSGDAGLGVTVPGAALGYRAAWDADELRTFTFAVGDLPENADQNARRPVATVDRPQADLPRLDAVDDWPGTVLVSTLAERARTMAVVQSEPALELTASPPSSFPPITRYGPGDDVTIRATTPLTPGGFEVTGRLIMVDVNAAEGTARWEVSTPSPPPRPRETLNRRLDRLDGSFAGLFHAGRLEPTEVTP